MEITIDLDILNKNVLSLSEYVYLKALFEERPEEEMKKIFKCIDRIEEDSLQERGFLRLLPGGRVILREDAIALFDTSSLFDKFVVMFPIKTPDNRYLSPASVDTIEGSEIKKKWDKRFKGKAHLEKRALDVLEAEIEWRKKTNQMMFMNNAKTWLHQGNYEKFSYLLEEKSKVASKNNKDFM